MFKVDLIYPKHHHDDVVDTFGYHTKYKSSITRTIWMMPSDHYLTTIEVDNEEELVMLKLSYPYIFREVLSVPT